MTPEIINQLAACDGFYCGCCAKKCLIGYAPRSREMELAREYKALERKYAQLVAVQKQELPLALDLLQKMELFAEVGCQGFDKEGREHVAGVLALLRKMWDDEAAKVRGEWIDEIEERR